jgi:hypothetical protein
MVSVQRVTAALAFTFALLLPEAFAATPEFTLAVTVDKRGKSFVVDASADFPVPLRLAWDVLTDFDHMASILSNLSTSQIVSRSEQTLVVRQEGVARFGIFSYPFATEREIRLKPTKRIVARQISGNAQSFVSELRLSPGDNGTEVRYHAEIVPDSAIARTFGAPFVRHEVEEQFTALAAEMARRNAR